MDIALPVAFALFFEQVILKNANAIVEGVNGAFHERRNVNARGSPSQALRHPERMSDPLAPIGTRVLGSELITETEQ